MPEPPDRLSPADEADLAALADGRLDPARRDELLARVAADEHLAGELDRQRAAVVAITAAASEVSAPLALRARIEELERAPAAPGAPARRRWRARSGEPARRGGGPAAASPGEPARRRRRLDWRTLTPAGALVLAVCAALVLVIGQGGATVDSVLAVATRPPVAVAAIGVRPGPLLDEQVEGVRFPNYAARFGWEPDGVRRDDVDGHATRTVFYRRDGHRIAYTVVGGDSLPEPDGGRVERRDGITLRALRRDGRAVVTWSRQGHTCVLSAEGVSEATLLVLASWRGRGKVAT